MTEDHKEPELIRSFDETFIAGNTTGEGDGLPLLIANGVGANLAILRRTIQSLSADRPVITWDLRGTFESGLPAGGRVDPEAHARDAMAVAKHFGAERFHLAAWSSGGRIALELAHGYPERIVSLALICAGYGHSLGSLLKFEFSSLLPRVAGLTRFVAGPIHGMLRNFVARPEVVGLVRQSGMISATADTPAFVEFLQGLASLDARLLFETYHAVSADAAPNLLSEVVAPTLVIAGERDQFTSRSMTTEMVAKIPDARLEVYEDATHYLPIEHPEKLAHDLQRFLKEIENTLR